MSLPDRADLDRLLAERLADDPGFRSALIADPRAAVSDLVGLTIPRSVSVTVHEESLTEIHLVIPAAFEDGLSEEDLELVSGGGCWDDCSCGGH